MDLAETDRPEPGQEEVTLRLGHRLSLLDEGVGCLAAAGGAGTSRNASAG